MLGKITLLGEPKSTQHIYKIACRPYPSIYMSAEGKAIKEDYAWQAKAQWAGKEMIDTPFKAEVIFYHGTKRRHDIDNHHKLWMDSFSRIVWSDDVLMEEMHVWKKYDKENPRIEVTLYDLHDSPAL